MKQQFSPLKRGDVIGLASISAPLHPDALRRGKEGLLALGYKVSEAFDASAAYGTKRFMFSAESAEVRARGLEQLFADPQVKLVLATRGAYGAMEILPKLNYDLIAKFPKPFVGFSDVTAALCAVFRKTGMTTYHGPALMSLFPDPTKETSEQQASRQAFFDFFSGAKSDILLGKTWQQIAGPVKGEGRLIGGNLSVLQSLLATPWEPELKGSILFFEEVGETPHRLHRMLLQLKLAGKLSALSGIIIGDLKNCTHSSGLGPTVEDVIKDLLSDATYPVIRGSHFGHGATNLVLPIGAQVKIENGRLVI